MTRTEMSPELENQEPPLFSQASETLAQEAILASRRRARRHRAAARQGPQDRPRADRGLLDPGRAVLELGLWAGYQMYEEWGGAPAAGVSRGSAGPRPPGDDRRQRRHGEGRRLLSR